jgi:hypothetical protein
MATRRLDGDIDHLYQLPLDQFTTARNALAKQAGTDGAQIRDLEKPAVAAWAVNQLYWHRRVAYDELIQAAEALRAAHKAVLGGRAADLRGTGQAHEKQIDQATKATLAVLADQGQPVTDATKQAIVTTLRALPVEGPPGRLTRPQQPGGFEMLQGLSFAPGAAMKNRTTAVPRSEPAPSKTRTGKPPVKPVNTKALFARARSGRIGRTCAPRRGAHRQNDSIRPGSSRSRGGKSRKRAHRRARRPRTRATGRRRGRWPRPPRPTRARDTAEHRAKQADAALDAARTRASTTQAEVHSLEHTQKA